MNICVIIPSHNLSAKLNKCLLALKKTNYSNISIVIIDNGSDKSLEEKLKKFKKIFKRLFFLENRTNLGFASAINQGLSFALKKNYNWNYFLILNNDAYVNSNFFIESVKILKKEKPDLFSPGTELKNSGKVDTLGLEYYTDGSVFDRKKNSGKTYLLGATSLFVSNKFADLNFAKFGWLFIPDFESYVEDAELSLRATLMQSKILLLDKLLVQHEGSSSKKFSRALYLGIRNQIWTIIITWTKKMIVKNLWQITKGQFINGIVYTLKFKNLFILKIYASTLLHLPRLMHLRKKIQANLLQSYPNNIFSEKNITLSKHLKNSRTYANLWKNFTSQKFA